MDESLRKIIENHESRIKELENKLGSSKKASPGANSFQGLSGGINLLISEGFFDAPREMNKIKSELEKKGYFYPQTSLNKILLVDFTEKKKTFNKIENGKIRKYVLRK